MRLYSKVLAVLCLLACPLFAQVNTGLMPDPMHTFLDGNGKPAAGGCVNFYQAGTSTPQATYVDSTGLIQNSNPVILDAGGRASVWLGPNAYKVQLKAAGGSNCSLGAQLWVIDNVRDLPANAIQANPSGAQTIAGALNIGGAVTETQPTAATSLSNQNSFLDCLNSSFWNGTATAVDQWCWQDVLGTGANPTSTYTLSHAGSSGTQTVSIPFLATFNGGFNSKTIDTIQFADQYASFQAALNALSPNPGGMVFLGNNATAPGIGAISSPISLAGAFSNVRLSGTGPFSSQIFLSNNSNTAMLLSGTTNKSRFEIDHMHFNGNKANNASAPDCIQLGETLALTDIILFNRSAVDQCNGNGLFIGQTGGFTNLYNAYFTNGAKSGVVVQTNTSVPIGGVDLVSVGTLSNFNALDGFQMSPPYPGGHRYLSLGDHSETNTRFAWNFNNMSGGTIFGGLEVATPFYFDQQTRTSSIYRTRMDAAVFDAGAYDKFPDNACDPNTSFIGFNGACARRNQIPNRDAQLDPSIVADWDMEASGTGSWTAGGNATIAKTTWISATAGHPYLKLTCSVAPCEVTQDVTDTLSANAWFRMASTEAVTASDCSVQIRRTTDNAIMVDSGGQPAVTIQSERHDVFWEAPIRLTAGNWRIALRNGSTVNACFFTDVRLVRNYVVDGSFENGLTNWSTQGAGTCTSDSTTPKTGTKEAKIVGNCNLYQAVGATLTAGEYYLVRAWINSSSGQTYFGPGDQNDGTQTDGFYANLKDSDYGRVTGAYQLVEWVTRYPHDFPLNRVGFSQVFGPTGTAFVDDVSVLHLRQNEQHGIDYFNQVVINGNNATQTIASGTAAMTTAAITAGNCGTTVTVAATNVLTTDTITWAFNAAPNGTQAGLVAWPTANNVNFAYCGIAETPAAATVNWRVVR